ncbi:MAG: hypothetical protein GYA17_17155 [Chloroflexi bacterium]|nr:hypothetical protein [Chloroflexota bacterium]
MQAKWINRIPWIALVGAGVAVAALAALFSLRQDLLVDSGQTRPVAEEALRQLSALRPQAVTEPGFLERVGQAVGKDALATLWVFDPAGKLVFSQGSTARAAVTGAGATPEMQRALDALPAGLLDEQQRLALGLASAIQAEGEHNDIYRHLLRPVYAEDGSLAGYLGAAYEISPDAGLPGAPYLLSLLAFVLGLGVYWLALPWWTWLDARRSGERAWAWAAFVLIGNLVPLLAYLLVRHTPRPGEAGA